MEAPASMPAGSEFEVAWTAPASHLEFVANVPVGTKEGQHGNYDNTRKDNPLELRTPDVAGECEVRYLTGQSRFTVTAVPVAIE